MDLPSSRFKVGDSALMMFQQFEVKNDAKLRALGYESVEILGVYIVFKQNRCHYEYMVRKRRYEKPYFTYYASQEFNNECRMVIEWNLFKDEIELKDSSHFKSLFNFSMKERGMTFAKAKNSIKDFYIKEKHS